MDKSVNSEFKEELKRLGAWFMDKDSIAKVSAIAYDKDKKVMNGDIIGQSPQTIARMAGIDMPDGVTLLVAELEGIGPEYPLSYEILAPVVAYFTVNDFEEAVNLCIDLNYLGGLGHSAAIFSNNEKVVKNFSMLMNAGRILVNMPSSQGAVGGLFNHLHTSFTLGCGSGGRNITTDNISARHLLNIQRICRRRMNERMASFDPALYYDENIDPEQLELLFNKNF